MAKRKMRMPRKRKPMTAVDAAAEEEVVASSSDSLPKGYTLLPGEKFIPFDSESGQDYPVDVENYFVSDEEFPVSSSESPLLSGVTRFMHLGENKVYIYMGEDSATVPSKPIWEHSIEEPKAVFQTEGTEEEVGQFLGVIVPKNKILNEKRAQATAAQRAALAEKIGTPTLTDIFDEMDEVPEKATDEED